MTSLTRCHQRPIRRNLRILSAVQTDTGIYCVLDYVVADDAVNVLEIVRIGNCIEPFIIRRVLDQIKSEWTLDGCEFFGRTSDLSSQVKSTDVVANRAAGSQFAHRGKAHQQSANSKQQLATAIKQPLQWSAESTDFAVKSGR